jgi:hypothetical protein
MAQSPQSGNEFNWYLVAAAPRWVLPARAAVYIDP